MAPKRKCMTNPSARHVPRELEEAPGEEGLRIAYGGGAVSSCSLRKTAPRFCILHERRPSSRNLEVKVMTSLVEKDDSPAKMITAEILT